ncbi:AAA family ATPase [Nocardioides sp. J54]|uniref:AAA family ATPase n=1 Tax=Nocardioides sp. J54 TaxID=935866 RepID=UPI00049037CA|nr:DUF3696 domain-containing protein [Nocardioides sp. J54]
MSDSTRTSGDERPISPEWVGLDREAMKARQDETVRRMREAGERWREEQKRSEEQLQTFLDRHADDSRPAEGSTQPQERKQRPRPRPLIERLHVENLKSLAGRHEIPLAPLTLVYGPNSAGKSTALKALQLFMHAVDTGKSDALNLWRRAFPDVRPDSVVTWEPQPEDTPFSQTRTLVLGVDFRLPSSGDLGRAELGFQSSDIGPWHSSTIGLAGDPDQVRKEFFLNFEDADPIDRGDFGNIGPRWEVSEWSGGKRSEPMKRDVDHLLFGDADVHLQRTLFRLAGQLTHFGPHRGNPAERYSPVDLDKIAGPDHWGIAGAPRWGVAGFEGHEVLNQLLEQLEIPHSFEPTFTSDQGGVRVSDWILADRRSGAPVPLSEVGYGVSQLLPVIDACAHATQRVISIEEPELHLHPRLQAKLANLFAFSVLRRGNQVIVETHSESLLLRVRRLVRSGKLLPDEVAVLYIDNTSEVGVSVRRLRLGEHGELLDPWPTGFFDDSLDDVLGGWG